ncbi:MAG TPA: histidine--tRNA ligase [Patescibacteria group bacterium]|nr:histidine--tRNA ligase [Patescibacteria group bacterium]
MIKAQTLKGFRDFLPVNAKKRQYVISTLKEVFEVYGFEPLETPTLEYEEVLTGKYGKEGDKLMYKFTDNGGRKVALKYDQTVPLARVIAQNQNNLVFPFKRYQIQPAFRAENPQKGRYREFMQCDIDIVGTDSLLSDFELIEIAIKGFEKLGFKKVKIFINDRGLLRDIPKKAITIIDKLKKIGAEKVKNELEENNLDKNLLEKLTTNKPSERIIKILNLANELSLDKKIAFDPTLARGLDYYTGVIIEAEDSEYKGGSLGGGGRYNNLISLFTGNSFAASGFSFGFDRIIDAMEDLMLFPKSLSGTKVLVTYNKNSIGIANKLRDKNIATEIFLEEKDLEKQLKYADRKNIPFVIIFDKDKTILKNMQKRTQEVLSIEEIIKKIK